MKKLLSWILVLALCLSLFPGVALAEDAEDPVGEIPPVEDPLPPAEDEDPGEPVGADAPGGPSGVIDVPTDDPAVLLTDPAADEIQAATASGTCGSNLTWILENGVLTISGTGAMTNWHSESSVPWYSYRETISQIILPAGLTNIGESAFRGCKYVNGVTIPSSVTSFGGGAFCLCSSLTTVTIPEGVTSIGDLEFASCSSLTSITIPNSVTSIGNYAFQYDTILTSVMIPESVTSIGTCAFESCSLTTFFFLGDAPSISYHAFYFCRGTALYPVDNETWTADKRQNYGGSLTWVGYRDEAKAYTIHYDPNGGSNAPEDQLKGHGVDIALTRSTPSRNGHNFVGWATDPDAAKADYASGATYCADQDITLYAVWSPYTYTVTYNANGGSGAPASQTKTYGENLVLSDTFPTRTGYSFQGWSTSSTDSTVSYFPGDTYTGNSNLTLYAVWKINTYTVTYDANGGDGAPENQTKTYGVDLTLSDAAPTLFGHTFEGWATDPNSTIAEYAPGAIYTLDQDITLYAVWSPITYSVNYDPNGGSGAPDSQTKVYGTDLTLSTTIPYREGYSFLGWSSYKWSAEAEYEPGDIFSIDQDSTLFAVWKEDTGAAASATLTLVDAQAAVGYPFTVELVLSENPGVMMINFKLDYDRDALEFLGGEDGALTGWYFSDSGAVWDASNDRTETGCVARLKFRMLEGCSMDKIRISITELLVGNYDEEAVAVFPVSCTVSIVKRIGGDVNNDGSVNGFDLIRLRKHLVGMDVKISPVNADANSDGVVDILDLVRLRKYLAHVNVDLG